MPLALARKYRPKSFAAVAVQTHVSATLKGAIARGRVAHGYLFCGPRGTGKTTLARVLAMALNCERRAERTDGEPCGECASCRRVWSGSVSLDVVEIDAASNRGVDDARELRERAMYAPSGDTQYKVYIVDEAHMLTREAWNALLKVLEEPPPRVVFVFATTEPQKIAQAAAPVLSRLQRFDLKRIGPSDIRDRLRDVLAEEGVPADDDALAMIARAADGSMRDALSLADQVLALGDVAAVTADRVRDALGLVPEDTYLEILALLAERRARDVFPAVERLADAGIDFGTFLAGLTDLIRSELAVVLGGDGHDLSERARAVVVSYKDTWAAGDLLRMLNAITELEPRFRKSSQQQLLLETLLVRCALLDRAVSLEAVLRELDAPGGTAGAPPLSGTPAPANRGGARTPGAGRGAASGAVRDAADARDARDGRPPQDAAVPVNAAREPAAPVATAMRPPAPRPAAPQPLASPAVASPAVASPAVASPAVASPAVASPTAGQAAKLDAEGLAARWPAVIERVQRNRQSSILAAALQQSAPELGTDATSVTVRLAERNEILLRAIETGRSDLLNAVRSEWPAVVRVDVALPGGAVASGPPKRLTAEAVKAEQVASLRRRDPVLGAAIDALDLELLD
jgi:DNA polymerase-3 subunit gamma/tau